MYTPRSFREEDPEVLHDLIRRHGFGVLFAHGPGGPTATHLPFVLDIAEDGTRTLVAHMARANPQWKDFQARQQVLVVFQGAHSYISPTWYQEPVAVPTWNYAAVHVYGVPRLVEDPAVLRTQVEALVRQYEGPGPDGWDMAPAEPKMEALLRAIVGFEIPVDRMEGKWKFNQNRSREDREGVVRALEGAEDPLVRETAEIMRRGLEE